MTLTPPFPKRVTPPKRTAVYTRKPHIADLQACAKHARQAGFRVVVMSHEQLPNDIAGLRDPKFQELVSRMSGGEFDLILAANPHGGIMMMGNAAGPRISIGLPLGSGMISQ
jgi:hypothetical protein